MTFAMRDGPLNWELTTHVIYAGGVTAAWWGMLPLTLALCLTAIANSTLNAYPDYRLEVILQQHDHRPHESDHGHQTS